MEGQLKRDNEDSSFIYVLSTTSFKREEGALLFTYLGCAHLHLFICHKWLLKSTVWGLMAVPLLLPQLDGTGGVNKFASTCPGAALSQHKDFTLAFPQFQHPQYLLQFCLSVIDSGEVTGMLRPLLN
jgi:hypothetical protein